MLVLFSSTSLYIAICEQLENHGSQQVRMRSRSDVSTKGLDNDQDLMNAIRLLRALDNEPDEPSVKSLSDRIVLTPIFECEPPTLFTKLFQAVERPSTTKTSVSLLPIPVQCRPPCAFSSARDGRLTTCANDG